MSDLVELVKKLLKIASDAICSALDTCLTEVSRLEAQRYFAKVYVPHMQQALKEMFESQDKGGVVQATLEDSKRPDGTWVADSWTEESTVLRLNSHQRHAFLMHGFCQAQSGDADESVDAKLYCKRVNAVNAALVEKGVKTWHTVNAIDTPEKEILEAALNECAMVIVFVSESLMDKLEGEHEKDDPWRDAFHYCTQQGKQMVAVPIQDESVDPRKWRGPLANAFGSSYKPPAQFTTSPADDEGLFSGNGRALNAELRRVLAEPTRKVEEAKRGLKVHGDLRCPTLPNPHHMTHFSYPVQFMSNLKKKKFKKLDFEPAASDEGNKPLASLLAGEDEGEDEGEDRGDEEVEDDGDDEDDGVQMTEVDDE